MNLVLASASPRRRELLAQAGFTFTVHPAHINEDPLPNEDPIAYVTRLARQKAETVFNELSMPPLPNDPGQSRIIGALYQGSTSVVPNSPQSGLGALAPAGSSSLSQHRPGAPGPSPLGSWESLNTRLIVLGADTTVTLDNHILGKPESPEDAARMLRLLSGRTHRVITGVALVSATQTRIQTQVAAEVTAVQFLTLSEQEIADYIATGEPNDKAGAYAIQGRAARWIPRIEGCYFNVVGLPIALVSTLLENLTDSMR